VSLLGAVLALPLLVVSAGADPAAAKPPRMDLLIGVNAQLRGGYTQSPFVTGPDAAPLASLGGASNAAPSAEFDTIVTPALTFGINRSQLKFSLGYQPRLFYDILAATPASVYHGVTTNLALGKSETWLLTIGANLSVGGLDFGQAGLAVNQFSGSPTKGGSSALSFYSTTGYVRLEHPLSQHLKFTTTQTAGKLGTPPAGGTSYLAGAALSTVPALQSQERLDSDWLFTYSVNPRHALRLGVLASLVTFPASGTYLSYWPGLGYEGQFGRTDKFAFRAGVFKYWTNRFPGVYLKPRYLITGAFTYEHNFGAINLPRLVLSAELTEQPYYDIVYGDVAPRATLNLALKNQFSRKFSGRVQLRDYSQAYFTGLRWLPIPKQRDKNVIVASAEVTYQFERWLGFTGGLYALNRWIQASATLPYTQLRDTYAYMGVQGTYDVR
jgi:hypothetical protein